MAGKNEGELGEMLRHHNIIAEKQEDMRFCWNCHVPVYKPKSSKEDTRELQSTKPDFEVRIRDRYTWIECKWGEDSFAWGDPAMGFHDNQRQFLNDYWIKWGVPVWLFLGVGPGPAPKNRSAWLIPWADWLMIEDQLKTNGVGFSIPFRENRRLLSKLYNCETLLSSYLLQWEVNVGWTLSEDHAFMKEYPAINGLPELYKRKKIQFKEAAYEPETVVN